MNPRQPLPGMAVPQYFPTRHSLTAADHAALVDAKVLRFDELDELARPHRHDLEVKRGNLTALGPGPRPLAYVVGPGLLAIAFGVQDATYGGWIIPGGEERPRIATGDEHRADLQAEREYATRQDMNDQIVDADARQMRSLRALERAR